MLPHEARIVGLMANPETMCKMLVRLEEENASLRGEVERLSAEVLRLQDELADARDSRRKGEG